MKRKDPRPPNGRLFFSGGVAGAICVGTVIKASLSGWVSTVAGLAGAVVVALVARLWHRQADLRYRRACSLADKHNDTGDTTS